MKKTLTIMIIALCGIATAAPVRSMVGARNIAIQDAKKESPYPLPEGAVKIEYLETQGRRSNANYGQHIVLPLLGNKAYIVEMDIELLYLNVAKTADICSIQASGSDRAIYLRIDISGMRYGIASSLAIRYVSVTNDIYARHNFRTEVNIANSEMRLYCDNELLLTCPGNPWSLKNLYLFACNQGQGNYTTNGARCKCWGVKAWDAFTNKLVMDLIPIRIGSVGYMFDGCSGEVLGNSGTESFLLGPDKE